MTGKVTKYNHHSEPVIFSATFMNISDIKFAQHELKHMTQLMRYIIDNSNSAIAVHDRNMNYVFVSENYLKQFDVEETNIIGRNHYDVFPDLPQKWRDVHQRVLKGAVVSADKDLYRAESGKDYWTRWECRPWHLSDGTIGGLIVYTEVINEALQTEIDKELYQNRLQMIMDYLPIGIALHTLEPTMKFIYVNDNFADIYGISKDDLLNNGNFWELVYEDSSFRKQIRESVTSDILSNNLDKMAWKNIPLHRKQQPTRYISAYAAPLKEENLYVSTVIDVTDENTIQEEIDYLTKHDTLTDLYSRDYFSNSYQRLDTLNNYPLGLILLDINGLKLINDAFGNEKGNLAIKEVSEVIKESTDDKALLARLGGDEFAIALPTTSNNEIEKIVKIIVDKANAITIEGTQISLTAGFAIKEDSSHNDLLKKAEDDLLKRKLVENRSARNHVIRAILNTLTAKYSEEKVHSERVSRFCKIIAENLGLKIADIESVQLAGLYHDIGKIAIPDAILDKPSSLNDEEYEIIKKHTKIGYDILKAADEYSSLAEDALYHHERFDGNGYPSGLKGTEIPLFSRIICVADAYEAMTSDRPYRKALSKTMAIDELKKHSGSQFDPEIVKAFLDHLES